MSIQLRLRQSLTALPAGKGMHLLYLLIEALPERRAADRTPLHCCLVVDWSPSMQVPIADEEIFRELMRRGLAREVVLDGLPVWRLDEGLPPEFAGKLLSPADWTLRAIGSVAERLARSDRFSLVAFATEARAVLHNHPGSELAAVSSAIETLRGMHLGQETSMAGGMELGLDLLKRYRDPARAERLLLLTDGFTTDGPRCRELAARAAADGVPLTTIGLGIEFEEHLLLELADRSGGRAAMVTDPAMIPALLDSELQRCSSTVARRLRLELRVSQNVELRRLYRVRPALAELPRDVLRDRTGTLSLGDMEAGQPEALLLELLAPAHSAGQVRLLRASLAADDPGGAPLPQLSGDLIVRYGSELQPAADQELDAIIARVSALRMQTKALESANAGDTAGATRQLRAAVTRLLELGEHDLASAAEQQARLLETSGTLDPASTKQLRYATRRLTPEDDTRPSASGGSL